jgi:hypothetical protein
MKFPFRNSLAMKYYFTMEIKSAPPLPFASVAKVDRLQPLGALCRPKSLN